MRSTIALALILAYTPPVAAQAPAADGWVTLGTRGGPIADAARSQPANVLVRGRDAWLIDVGDGTAQALARAGIAMPRVRGVWLSHLHFDHTGGLSAIIGLRYQTDVLGPLAIYGPPGTKALVAGIIASMQPAADAGYGLPGARRVDPASIVTVTELTDGQSVAVDGMTVRAVQNTHYSFAPGSDADRRFKSYSYRFDLPGRSIVYTGDTGPSPAVERLAQGADLLVSEMIDVDTTVDAVRRNTPGMAPAAMAGMKRHLSDHHLTPPQVGELAARAGVKRLVVTHFVAPDATPAQLAGYLATIRKTYAGPAVIANDLDRF